MSNNSKITSYPFEKLKRYSREDARLIGSLAQLFPSRNFETPLVAKLAPLFKKYVGQSLEISYESLFESSYEQFVGNLAEHFVCFGVSLTPHVKPVIIEADSDLIFSIIDRTLGGDGASKLAKRALTPLEEGLLQFLVIECLQEVALLFENTEASLKWRHYYANTKILGRLEKPEARTILLTFRVRLGSEVGYVRLCFFEDFLKQVMASQVGDFAALASNQQKFLALRWQSLEHLRTVLWAEVGKVSLTTGEWAQLEKGDIVMFDEASPRLDNHGQLSGDIFLRCGDGESGGLMATLEVKDQNYMAKIRGVFGDQ